MQLIHLLRFFTRPGSIISPNFRYQFLATLTANIILFSHGIGIGWLSPTLTKLQSIDSPVNFFVGITELSWIGSLVGLGSLMGNIIFGYLLNRTGRKVCLYLIAIPHMIHWCLIYFAESVEFLYVGRFLGGITGGGSYCVVAIFISEIADASIRGTLSSFLMLSVNSGILVGIILASYLPYHLIPLVVIMLPTIYLIAIAFFPDTPVYLMKKGDLLRAEQALRFYKNVSSHSTDLQSFNQDFDELRMTIAKGKISGKLTFANFVTRPVLKAYAVAMVLLFVNQFGGSFAFVSYMSKIFEESGSIIDPNASSIITCAVQIIGVLTSVFFVDRYGRKILLLISTAGSGFALTLFGLYTYFSHTYAELDRFSWMPLVVVMCYIFFTNIGIVTLTVVVLVELFPAKLRSITVSFGMAVLSILVFSMLKIFPIYMHTFGITVTMWSCAGVAFFSFVFFLLFLKETKGKSMLTDDQ